MKTAKNRGFTENAWDCFVEGYQVFQDECTEEEYWNAVQIFAAQLKPSYQTAFWKRARRFARDGRTSEKAQ
jgi:hypothetical protein